MSSNVDDINVGTTNGLSDAERFGQALTNFQNTIGLTPQQNAHIQNSGPATISFSLSRLHQATSQLLNEAQQHHNYMTGNLIIHPGTNPGQLVSQMENQTREWEQMRSAVEAAMRTPQNNQIYVINPSEVADSRNWSRRIGNQTF